MQALYNKFEEIVLHYLWKGKERLRDLGEMRCKSPPQQENHDSVYENIGIAAF